MTVKQNNQDIEVKLRVTKFTNNGNTAILLTLKNGSPFTRLTVNLDEKLPPYYAYVDTNNTPWAEEFIMKYRLGEPAGKVGISGFCLYPLYRFNKDIVERYTE